MRDIDRQGVDDAGDSGESRREAGLVRTSFSIDQPQDPATFAARVIEEQSLSIFAAVEAATSEIETRARRETEDILGGANEAIAPAKARLDAISRSLEALSRQVDRAAEDRAAGRSRGG
jgi:hypothetical protein